MKTLLQISLDTANSHDKTAYDIITSQPKNNQREFLIAAVLYYSKSPSFLAEVKMGEYLEQIKRLNEFFSDTSLVEVTTRLDELASIKEDLIEQVSSAVLKKLEGLEFSSSTKSRKKAQVTTDIPDDAMGAMADAFST